MTHIEKPTRYWGVAILSVLWVLVMVLLNAAGGSRAGNANTALWLVVAYWAFRGNAQLIQTASRYFLIISLTVGGAVFIFLHNDPDTHLYFGSPELFLLSIAIPTIAWGILYWWASSKIAASNAEERNKRITSLPDRHMSNEETRSDLINHNTNTEKFSESTIIGELKEKHPSLTSKAIAEKMVYPVESTSTTAPTRGIDFPKALKVIEYSEEASKAWEQVKSLPEECPVKFLDALEKNPAQDVELLVLKIIEARRVELRPYDDDLANDAVEQARTISKEATAEFHEVYQLLQNKISPDEILKKLEAKYGMSKRSLQELELAKQAAETLERERLEAVQLKIERQEAEHIRLERQETQRLEAEQLELDRQEAVRVRQAFLEAQRLEDEQLELQQREAEALKKAEAEKQENNEAQLSFLNKMAHPANLMIIIFLIFFIIVIATHGSVVR